MHSRRRFRTCSAVVSFALDDAGVELVGRVHDAGGLAMQQITTVRQAQLAVEHGVDIIVAQVVKPAGTAALREHPEPDSSGSRRGKSGPGRRCGGIADGRGIAAAVTLGAAGVNLGSRFLASDRVTGRRTVEEGLGHLPVRRLHSSWVHQRDDPNPGHSDTERRLRLLRTEFVERWEARSNEVEIDPAPVLSELNEAVATGEKEALLVVRRSERGPHPTRRTCGRDSSADSSPRRESARRGRGQFEL